MKISQNFVAFSEYTNFKKKQKIKCAFLLKNTNNKYSFLNFDYRPPLIINKEKISNGECPDVDDDMRDIDIEEEEDDRCGDCPYCDSRVSIT